MMKANLLPIVDRFAGQPILVIGEAILDRYTITRTQRLCREAPAPVADVRGEESFPGGAAHAAVNVATLGGAARFLTVIGADEAGQLLNQKLQEYGVDTQAMLVDPQRRTLVKQRILVNGQMLLRCDEGDTAQLSAEIEEQVIEQLQQLAPTCAALLVSDYDYGILTERVVQALCQVQATHRLLLAVDSKRLPLFKRCRPTVVKPNYEQVVTLLQAKPLLNGLRPQQVTAASDHLFKRTGARMVAATLDAEGALVLERDKEAYRTYSEPTSDANTVGAGDTYISAFVLALAAGATREDAAELAAQASAIAVRWAGTAPCWQEELRVALTTAPGKRLYARQQLARTMQNYRAQGKQIVFTNGCFDLIHPGHVDYLNKARALGDVLVVGVNTDESVRRYKGASRPINPLDHRLEVLAGLASVDHVIEFDEDTPIELIKLVQPDIYVKGGDYTEAQLPEALVVRELGGDVQIIPFLTGYSTTAIVNKIKSEERLKLTGRRPTRATRPATETRTLPHHRQEVYE
jgi:D-beta-D-heptose 7-phosphate kinase/D-beta-D-heptose 1-phosphate adenosyltransferase